MPGRPSGSRRKPGWETRRSAAIPGIQSYLDQLNWNPHLHGVVSDVAWDRPESKVGRVSVWRVR